MTTTHTTKPHTSSTQTVAKNFGWRGLELGLSIVATLLTSIAVARTIGPQKLGYFNYVYWLSSTAGLLGSLGIPSVTLKYMAEYLGAEQPGLARSVYEHSLLLQTALSILLTGIGEAIVFTVGDPQYKWISGFLVLSVIPQMIQLVPSQANNAAEDMAANTRGALVGLVVNVIAVWVSLALGWDLIGIAVGVFLYRAAEMVAKLIPVRRWVRSLPSEPLPADVRKRMMAFSGRSTGLLLLQMVIFDRSDVFFLKFLQNDIKQVAFFSISFSLADRILLMPQAFAGALGATQMAQYGRGKEGLYRMTSLSLNYMTLISLPLLVGSACLSGSIVHILYGPKYLPAIPVFALVALLAISRSILGPVQTLLISAERLQFLIKWQLVCGVFNVAMDFALIPPHGAVGAALANGFAQTLAAAGMWWYAVRQFNIEIQRTKLAKIVAASAVMAVAVLAVKHPLSARVGQATLGMLAGALALLVLLRVLSVLQQDDRSRLLSIGRSIPASIRAYFVRLVDFLVPEQR